MFDRKVTRIITPGTLIDERFMDTAVNNFLLAIYVDDAASSIPNKSGDGLKNVVLAEAASVGLAWVDLSTGDFYTQSTRLPSLLSAIARIGPREIILNHDAQAPGASAISCLLEKERLAISYHANRTRASTIETWLPFLANAESITDATQFSAEELAAGTGLLDYIEVQLQGLKTKLQAPIRRHTTETMAIDKNSMRALEIKTTLRDGASKGSLLHAMRKTVTNSGSRLLSDWLSKMPLAIES